MISDAASCPRHRRLFARAPQPARRLALCVLLMACSGNVIVMGENGDAEEDSFVPPAYSRCVDNRTLTGDVAINDQAELDALEGCSTIDGHVQLRPFFEPDLRPLHRLRVVRGELGLGGGDASIASEWTTEEAALANDLTAAGFLHSLAGLERLETVGSLTLTNLAVASLAPLAQLRQLTDSGMLTINDCDALEDLTPLARLSGIQRLALRGANIVSLDGLQVREQLVSLSLSGARLSNIAALSSLSSVTSDIVIDETALRDLAPLAQLGRAGGLYLTNNASLESLSGLAALRVVDNYLILNNNDALQDVTALGGLMMSEFLIVQDNDNLRRLTEFPGLRTNSIQIADNPLLEEVPLLQGTFYAYSRRSDAQILLRARGQVEITRNAALQRVTVPDEWLGGIYVIIRDNAALRELDLSDLETLDLLEISHNPGLDTLRLGALERVDTLEVVDNPLLPATTFDPVRTFERTMSGNAGDAP